MGYIESRLNKDEKITFQAKVHWSFTMPRIILGVLVCLPLAFTQEELYAVAVLFLIIAGSPLSRLLGTKFGFTNKRIIGKIGLIKTQSLDSPLNKIDNVSVSRGLLGRIFGYGTVEVRSQSGMYRFKGMAKPESIRQALMAQIEQYDEDRIKKQASEMASAMRGTSE